MKNYLLIPLIFVFLFGCEKPVEDAQKSYDNKDYKGAYDHLLKIEKEDDVGDVFDKKQKLVIQIIEGVKDNDQDLTLDLFKLLDENSKFILAINKIVAVNTECMRKNADPRVIKVFASGLDKLEIECGKKCKGKGWFKLFSDKEMKIIGTLEPVLDKCQK